MGQAETTGAPAKGDDEALLAQAKRRFTEAQDADRENRERGLEDAQFEAGQGGQWPAEVRRRREEQGSLCMEFSHLRGFVRQVSNELRMQPPGIKVTPVEDADTDTAQVIEGLVRSIELQSRAQRIYARAGEDAARCNMGFWRVATDYVSPDSFDQEILIKPVLNPFSVLFDPAAQDATCRDARYCFVYDDMPREEFRAAYPDKAESGFYAAGRDGDSEWICRDTIRIAEYWVVEETPATLLQFVDGSNRLRTAYEDDRKAIAAILGGGGMARLDSATGKQVRRRSVRRKVMMYKLSAAEVLERFDWMGERIPIVPVWGEEARVGGRRVRNGVISFAKDAQRLLNFSRSAMAERMALSPKAPWLVTPRQIEGFETQWRGAAQGNPFALPYNPDPQVPGGRPERIAPADVEMAMIHQAGVAVDDLKATVGIYDASLGATSNETSGIAIMSRQKECDVGTFAFVDNVIAAIEETGRIIVDLIPHVYDGAREVRILGRTMTPLILKVNQAWLRPGPDGRPDPVNIDLTVGRYDVAVTTGPSVSTQRVETSQTLTSALQAAPNLAPIILPRLAAMMNLPDAEEFAEEVRQAVSPRPPQVDPTDQANAALAAARADGQHLDNAAKAAQLHQVGAAMTSPAPAPGAAAAGQPGAPDASPGQSAPFSFQKTSWSVS